MLEDSTGILLIGALALGLRDAIVINRDQQLCIPLKTDQRKLSQCDIVTALSAIVKYQILIKALRNTGGNFSQAAFAAGIILAAIRDTGIQNNGIDSLYHSRGKVAANRPGDIQLLHDSAGREYLCTALAAKQDAALVEDAETLCLGTAGRSGADLKGYPVEKAHINGVKSAVEGYRFHICVDVKQFGGSALDHLACRQDILSGSSRIEAKIVDTILITTAVKNLFRMDAYSLPDTAQITDRARHSIFSHNDTSLKILKEVVFQSSVCVWRQMVTTGMGERTRHIFVDKSEKLFYNRSTLNRGGFPWE